MFEQLSDRIQYIRKAKNATMEQIASIADVSQATVSQWCNGKIKSIKNRSVDYLSSYYNVDPVWLLTGKGAPEDCHADNPGSVKIHYYLDPGNLLPYQEAPLLLTESMDKYILIDRNFFTEHNQLDIGECKIVKAFDDSMAPIIFKDDILLLDMAMSPSASDIPYAGKTYLFTVKNKYYIRNLFLKLNGDLVISSENPKFGEDLILASDIENVEILGRIAARFSTVPFL